MIRRILVISSFLILSIINCFGQRSKTIDSLIALQNTVDDTVLPRLYHDISYLVSRINPVLGMQYARMSLDAARENQNQLYETKATYMIGLSNRELGNYQESLEYFKKSLDLSYKYGYDELIAMTNSSIGNIYMQNDSLDLAEKLQIKTLEVGDSINNSDLKSRAYINLGLIFKKKNAIDSAIKYMQMAYLLSLDSSKKIIQRFLPIKELSDLYISIGDYDNAKMLLNRYLVDISSKIDEQELCYIWHRLAHIYYDINKLDSSEAACKKSIEVAIQARNIQFLEKNYKLIDSVYLAQKKYKLAALYSRQLIDLSDTLFNSNVNEQLSKIYYSIEYLENKKELDKAESDREHLWQFVKICLFFLFVILLGVWLVFVANRKVGNINNELDKKKAAITQRVECAYSIQKNLLPEENDFGTSFSDRFIYFSPRDIVSGDFYWKFSDAKYEMLAVADCTGHGIPGALLSAIGASLLQEIAVSGIRNSSEILNILREKLIYMMEQSQKDSIHDGMDISLIVVDKTNNSLDFAGAYNSLYCIRNGELNVLKATRAPIGYYLKKIPFESQHLDMQKGDVFYMFSDGYVSQFGIDKKTKYSPKRFKELLLNIHTLPMKEQKEILVSQFKKWKGPEAQIDDVTVVGLRL